MCFLAWKLLTYLSYKGLESLPTPPVRGRRSNPGCDFYVVLYIVLDSRNFGQVVRQLLVSRKAVRLHTECVTRRLAGDF